MTDQTPETPEESKKIETPKKPKAKIIKFVTQPDEDGMLIVDLIEKRSDLSKITIKKLMVFGSVFQTMLTKRKRVRKAKSIQKAGNTIEVFYDPKIDLDQKCEFKNLYETKFYGIYLKPAGALTEGTSFGDKTSLFRYVEQHKGFAYTVNRLDRETEGLVVIAYDSITQNLLQEMWRNDVIKKYQAIVLGKLEGSGELSEKINNKFSQTNYESIEVIRNHTHLAITAVTERKQQIRKHLSGAGHPVIGDPVFGDKNKNKKEGLKLVSCSLKFTDPHSKKEVEVLIPEDKLLF